MSTFGYLQALDPKKDYWSFQSAIQTLLDGRDKYPWGHSLGLSSSQIDGMVNKGIMPKGNTIGLICETERASGTWITTGKGAPFNVWHVMDQADATNWLSHFCAYNPGAKIYTVSHNGDEALVVVARVTSTPAQGKSITYDQVTVLHGVATSYKPPLDIYSLALTRDNFRMLVTGQMGNQAFFRLAENAEEVSPQTAEAAKAAETAISPEHMELIARYELQPLSVKEAIWRILGEPKKYTSLEDMGLGEELSAERKGSDKRRP